MSDPRLGLPDEIEPGRSSSFTGWLLNHGSFEFLTGGKILEVGVGRQRIVPGSKTVDSDARVNPDVVADIRKMPFGDKEFDLAIAHEAFCRHDAATQAAMLKEIKRVSRGQYLRQWRLCAWPGCGFKIDKDGKPLPEENPKPCEMSESGLCGAKGHQPCRRFNNVGENDPVVIMASSEFDAQVKTAISLAEGAEKNQRRQRVTSKDFLPAVRRLVSAVKRDDEKAEKKARLEIERIGGVGPGVTPSALTDEEKAMPELLARTISCAVNIKSRPKREQPRQPIAVCREAVSDAQ